LSIEIRRLGSDHGDVVTALAEYPGLQQRIELLAAERSVFFEVVNQWELPCAAS
jgi:hypothetical protein